MNRQELQDLVDLPEGEALQTYFDRRNLRVLASVSWIFAAMSFGALLAALSGPTREPILALFCAANLAGNLGLFFLRRRPSLPGAVRRWLLLYLALQAAILLSAASDDGAVVGFAGVALPTALLVLHLRPGERVFLVALLSASSWFVLARLTSAVQPGGPTGPAIGVTVLATLGALGGWWRTRTTRRRFLLEWHVAVGESRERSRLRSELALARQVQLGMLPAGPPDLTWLELAASCDPAAEVGGDYYDWIVLSPTRVALVVGDVAGHGMASGLVLAGVRSCLYLLRRELAAPADVLARLDEVVRETGARRMFMTLLIVVLDAERHEARVVSAGHPPALRWSASRVHAESLGVPSPPLGTKLGAQFHDEVVTLAAGDLLVLHTDGVIESRRADGEPFGEERLAAALQAAASGSAAEICSRLGAALRDFRAERPADDDCTILVARLGELPDRGR